MSHLDDFEAGLIEDAPDVSFGWEMFAPILIQTLIDLLSGCGQDGEARAKAALRGNGSVWSRRALRQAVRKASEESGTDVSSKDLNAVSNHLVSYGKTCSDDELDALFRETDELINVEFL